MSYDRSIEHDLKSKDRVKYVIVDSSNVSEIKSTPKVKIPLNPFKNGTE